MCEYMLTSMDGDQLLQLQIQMESVKEENTRLRKLVEQTLEDYRHLEMKFPVIDKTKKMVRNYFFIHVIHSGDW